MSTNEELPATELTAESSPHPVHAEETSVLRTSDDNLIITSMLPLNDDSACEVPRDLHHSLTKILLPAENESTEGNAVEFLKS